MRYLCQPFMRYSWIIMAVFLVTGCHSSKHTTRNKTSKNLNRILKNPDPAYKLRIAEQYFVDKKYSKAQQVFEDIMPYYKTSKEFEDIYYKYAFCAYYQQDYLNAENLYKGFLEIFPNSVKAEEMDFMRADCFYQMSAKPELDQTNTIKAMGMMQTFVNTHPGSTRNKQATGIIDICRNKLETKDYKSAQLYYDLGQFRAAGVAFTTLLNAYAESSQADEYKLMIIKSYYRFAELSVEEKKTERFEQVINECREFAERFPDSKLKKEADQF